MFSSKNKLFNQLRDHWLNFKSEKENNLFIKNDFKNPIDLVSKNELLFISKKSPKEQAYFYDILILEAFSHCIGDDVNGSAKEQGPLLSRNISKRKNMLLDKKINIKIGIKDDFLTVNGRKAFNVNKNKDLGLVFVVMHYNKNTITEKLWKDAKKKANIKGPSLKTAVNNLNKLITPYF